MPLFLLMQLLPVALTEAASIADSQTCYTISRNQDGGGRLPIGVTWQEVKRDRQDGREVLRVVVHQRGIGGRFDMRDAFVLSADTLQPISFENSRKGERHVALRYEPGRVEGERIDNDVTQPIDVALPGPVWEGNLFGVTFAGLALREGATFHLPYFQYDKGVGAFDVDVAGSETVPTPDGSIDAWVVEATTGVDVRITYLIAKDGRRELGYRGRAFSQEIGGDCSALQASSEE